MIETARKFLNCGLVEKYRIIDYYNEHCAKLVKPSRRYTVQYTDNWCATFTSVIAHKCGLTKDQFPYECGVEEQVKIAISNNNFTTDIEQVNQSDLIIYDWNSDKWADHVGIVIEVSNGTVKVIEGNIRNTVGYRTLPINSKSIKGFIKTHYKQTLPPNETERIAELARRTVKGEFGNGADRISNLGSDYKAVQDYINIFYK